MTKKVRSYKFKFDYNMFRNDVQSFCDGLQLKHTEFDKIAGVGGGITNAIINERNPNHKMDTWLAIANAMDVDVRTYFVLDV